jgi:hypothetical protein
MAVKVILNASLQYNTAIPKIPDKNITKTSQIDFAVKI